MAQEFDVTAGTAEPGLNVGRQEGAGFTHEEKERLIGETKTRTKGFLAEQKGRVATFIDDLAGALDASVRHLNAEHSHPTSANYLSQAANKLKNVSGTLQQRDVDSMLNQARDFARRQPVLVLAGTLLIGFYLARALRSGSEREEIGPEYGSTVTGSEFATGEGSAYPSETPYH